MYFLTRYDDMKFDLEICINNKNTHTEINPLNYKLWRDNYAIQLNKVYIKKTSQNTFITYGDSINYFRFAEIFINDKNPSLKTICSSKLFNTENITNCDIYNKINHIFVFSISHSYCDEDIYGVHKENYWCRSKYSNKHLNSYSFLEPKSSINSHDISHNVQIKDFKINNSNFLLSNVNLTEKPMFMDKGEYDKWIENLTENKKNKIFKTIDSRLRHYGIINSDAISDISQALCINNSKAIKAVKWFRDNLYRKY